MFAGMNTQRQHPAFPIVRMEGEGPEAFVTVLREGVKEIDRTFALVGARFGEGLELFEGLKNRLLALSKEIAHPELTEARSALAALAEELPKLETRLNEEKIALATLSARSQSVGKVFVALRSNMRLVAILTQRARIERASIPGHIKDLEAFTDEVVTLSLGARQSVEDCARRHGEVEALIARAAEAQGEFENRFGRSLSELARRLSQTLHELGERQGKSIDAVNKMVDHSAQVVAATGDAVMALQSGDNIRQRLEHSIAALGLSDAPIPRLRPILFSIEAAQLRATADLLHTDCRRVDQTIQLLGERTSQLVLLVRGFVGGADSQASSSLVTELETSLTTAADLLRTCEADRRTVDGVMTQLTSFLEGFEATVAKLRKTAVDIVFLGTNAGLRASHIGEGGRSLLVIARELKIAADMVERDARELGQIFSLMLGASADLRQRTMETHQLTSFDSTVQRSLGAIHRSGERMATLLGQLDEEAGQFIVEISSARRAFATIAHRTDVIMDTAEGLLGLTNSDAPAAGPDELQQAFTLLQEKVWPLYTMAAERSIHRAVLADFGFAEDEVPQVVATPAAQDDFEAF